MYGHFFFKLLNVLFKWKVIFKKKSGTSLWKFPSLVLPRNAIMLQHLIIWLAPWAGKMNQILGCDWLPERARWSCLAHSGLPVSVSRKKNFPESHVINPSLTKLVRSRWLDIVLILFCEFMDLDSVSVHKHAKTELGQYPAILTSHLVNNPYILSNFPSITCHVVA